MARARLVVCLVGLIVMTSLFPLLQPDVRAQETDETAQADVDAIVVQLITTVIQALSIDWDNWLRDEWNMPIPQVNYFLVEPGESYTSACGDHTTYTYDYNNAEYCSLNQADNATNNGMIIIPIGSMIRMVQGDIWGRPMEGERFPGMYATVAIVAHEFGHFLNFEILEWFSQQGYTIRLAQPPNVELLADCIAGEFIDTYDASTNRALTDTDVQNIVTALGLIADPHPNVGTHGTAAQRAYAFLVGYTAQPNPFRSSDTPPNQSSDVGIRLCFDTYWP